jgi:hypothetical protein
VLCVAESSGALQAVLGHCCHFGNGILERTAAVKPRLQQISERF